LSDFKLRLASGLTGTMPVTHAQVMSDDSMSELGAKVLGNTALAILQVRDQLNRDQIERAIDLINGADRIEFHAVGHYGGVALDAQFKFLRLGISSMAYSDPRLQVLAASVLTVRDVVVVISSTGRVAELLEVADKARERGAAVIAITASQSPLARKADVALIVDHVEDVATQLPMVSRILHLLVIDILAVGVAMRRSVNLMPLSEESAVATETVEPAATEPGLPVSIRKRRTPPGVSASLPLARLTSHSRR
jgi:glucokinase